MATVLKINRQVEIIEVRDESGEVAYAWEVETDDKSITKTLNMVGGAMDKFSALQTSIDNAENDEERKQQEEAMTRLLKRCITAIIGGNGYNDVLAYIGGDYGAADPSENIVNLGEVFAALCTWLYEHCTSKQLREVGVYFESEQKRAGGRWAPAVRKSKKRK